ncbi:MAG TPA: glycerophosphodiester phosphodiesterase family protein, partial [Pseudomonadales bacterium]
MATDKLANASVPGPIVIANRGASGRRPEHTLAAYELAIVQGADFIELDLVATADGALVARHENALAVAAVDETGALVLDASGRPVVVEATTDVAEHAAFADRLTVKQVDGRPIGGWFSEDFTLAELARLRARERLPDIRPANRVYDDAEGIPTLAQVIDLVRAMEARGAGRAGLYIELKHPTYFASEGRRLDGSPIALDLVGLLLEALSEAGFFAPDRLFVQCFEVAPLIEFEDRQTARGWDIPLIQLFGDVDNRSYRA